MNQGQELTGIARAVIDSILYMVLGTSDELGRPWVSPVYFASAEYREFFWMSSPEGRHSRNIYVRPDVSIVIFDSRIPVGMGQAVYMSAVSKELTGTEFDRGIQIYNGRFSNPADHGVRVIKAEDVRAPAPYRLYRAIAHEQWILDPASHPDHRTPVSL